MPEGLAAFWGLRDRELLSAGLVVAEGRLLALRLLEAAVRTKAESDGPPAPGLAGLPGPRFEAIALACVPSLEAELFPIAEGLCPLFVLPEAELAGLAGYPFHRGVLGLGRRLPSPAFDPGLLPASGPSRLLILPATIDPENLGAMTRSAAALGYAAILAGEGTCDPLSRRALRVSMGGALKLPFFRIEGPGVLEDLCLLGYGLAAAVLDSGAALLSAWKAPPRLGLLIGNEYEGLGREWLPEKVVRLTIPMEAGSDSLNAAAAAAIFLYEASRA